MKRYGIPLLVVAIASVGTLYLARQDRAVKVNDQGVPVQPPAPKWEMPGYRQPVPSTGPPPVETKGTFRSLDKINAAAARVGCDPLKPDDPAGKLIDVAECLGARAVAPGQK
jgi:hypothetical protein